MKKQFYYFVAILFVGSFFSLTSCDKDDDTTDPIDSATELLVKKFDAAPNLDGAIDEMWSNAQKLVGEAEVPDLAARGTYLNSDGEGVEEDLGLFDPYSLEVESFTLRSGYYGDEIYFLMEWDDVEDSKDRQSWYYDASDKLWKGEHKYANANDDKFYEDKFAFLFPIGDVAGFDNTTCYATCHGPSLPVMTAKDKHTRHYLNNEGEKVDMWHWKRVRGTYNDRVDDQKMLYDDANEGSGANGRTGDATGQSGYANNSQTLTITGTSTEVSVPLYVIPEATNYYWIGEDELGAAAKLITAVDENGVLTYDGGTIDPADGGFEQGIGNKRIPSVTTRDFTEGRGDITIKAVHTGSGWVCEFKRKLNTGDEDDVVFEVTKQLAFGLAIFNNAAIAHAIKPNLTMLFEE